MGFKKIKTVVNELYEFNIKNSRRILDTGILDGYQSLICLLMKDKQRLEFYIKFVLKYTDKKNKVQTAHFIYDEQINGRKSLNMLIKDDIIEVKAIVPYEHFDFVYTLDIKGNLINFSIIRNELTQIVFNQGEFVL